MIQANTVWNIRWCIIGYLLQRNVMMKLTSTHEYVLIINTLNKFQIQVGLIERDGPIEVTYFQMGMSNFCFD